MSPSLTGLAVSLLPYAVAMSFTPGPNNLMLASAGARFGFLRTLPHLSGVVLGYAVLTMAVGLGIADLVTRVPLLYTAMKYASILYLLYLAWAIATAERAKTGAAPGRPMTFLQAAAFQWINPKGWIMALGAVTTYTTLALDMRAQIVLITVVFAVVGLSSASTWTVFGLMIQRYLTTTRRRLAFNWTMAALLVASIAPALVEL